MTNNVLEEALQYFREENVYQRLFSAIRQKYESLGRFGGTIDLTGYSEQEVERIALFMGVYPHHLRRRGKLMLAQFEQRLQETRFAGITLHALLEAYYGERVQSKKSLQEALVAKRKEALAEFKQLYPAIEQWFVYLAGRSSDTHWIWRLLLEADFAEDVRVLAAAYAALPERMERYPLFSQRVTGDPHALDLGTVRGNLWMHLLHVMAGEEGAPPKQTDQVNELLLGYRLIRDDIHNFVTLANLLAYIGERVHPVWQAAVEERVVLNVPLRELLKVSSVTTANKKADVYVVENSGVFSALLDEVPDAPLICTHGQFKLAGLQLMDLLQAAGYTLHYSGDFDPEGLSMALRFVERYGESAKLWRMTVRDYEQSEPVVELEDIRDGKLDALLGTSLADVALAMRERGKIGYQEGIMQLLVQDLRNGV